MEKDVKNHDIFTEHQWRWERPRRESNAKKQLFEQDRRRKSRNCKVSRHVGVLQGGLNRDRLTFLCEHTRGSEMWMASKEV